MARIRKRSRQLCEGIVRCGCCGRKLKSDQSFYFCPSGCVLRTAVETLDACAIAHLRAVTRGDVKEAIDSKLRAWEQEKSEGSMMLARKRVETAMDDLQAFLSKQDISLMPDDLARWLTRPLPDKDKLIWQAEEMARLENTWNINTDEYFSVEVPENPMQHFDEAKRAVLWYINSIMLHADYFEFSSTFDGWLRLKTARACGFEQEEERPGKGRRRNG